MNNTKCHPMTKRLLSVLFAITLVAGLVPISAYAATGDSQGTTTSSNENGVSSSANAIIVVGDAIEWKYNGGQGVAEKAIYNKLAETYKYRVGMWTFVPYTGYKIEDKMFTTASKDDKFWKPESRTYDVTGAENFVRWRKVCKITFQKQWDTTFATTPAGEGSIVKQDGSSFADNKDTSNDNATVTFKVEKVNGKTVTVNRYNSKGDKVFSWHQPTLVGEDEKYITYSFTADRNSTIKVEYKAENKEPSAELTATFDSKNATALIDGNLLTSGKPTSLAIGEHSVVITPTPEGDSKYAVTSVVLNGGKYRNQELPLSFGENRAARVNIPELEKNGDYTLTVTTESSELKLKDDPSPAVRGLTDTAKIK